MFWSKTLSSLAKEGSERFPNPTYGCSWSLKPAAAAGFCLFKGFSQWIHMWMDVLAPLLRHKWVNMESLIVVFRVVVENRLLGGFEHMVLSAAVPARCQAECHPLGSTLHGVFSHSIRRSVKSALWAWVDSWRHQYFLYFINLFS